MNPVPTSRQHGSRLVFSDLDGCLFSTARRQRAVEECVAVADTLAGQPSGWQNRGQAALFAWLQMWGEVVPVTARTLDALARVRLPLCEHAIWCHGAGVRVHGAEDGAWREASLAVLEPLRGLWPRLAEALRALPWPGEVRVKPIDDPVFGVAGLDLFGRGVEQAVNTVRHLAREAGSVRCASQADRLTLLPDGINKERAVAHVIQRLAPSLTVGVGDSLSDVPFLALCDQVVLPGKSLAFQHLARHLPMEISA